jgi:protocatechuate 3,4-dioxygenase beta subunit
MDSRRSPFSRRAFLGAVGVSVFAARGVFAEQLSRTPALTEGPFYPDRLPLDTDNDLVLIKDASDPAVGEVTHLTGRILDPDGKPVRDALIEIWQCDANAVYLHTADSGGKQDQQDKKFQGYGRFTTDKDGGYRFRTIKPVPYPGRPSPHIHYKITKGGRDLLTSQIFIAGHEGNARDGVFRGLRDPIERELVMTEFAPIKESKTGELAAKFDVILGHTPDERAERRASGAR